jgi:hypothetical protein
MTMEINENHWTSTTCKWFSHSGDWFPSRSLHMDSSKWHELERGSSLFDFTIGSRGVAETAARCEQGSRVINVWQASWPAELFWKPRVSHWSHHLLSCYKRLKCLCWITNTTPFLFWNPEMPSPHHKLSPRCIVPAKTALELVISTSQDFARNTSQVIQIEHKQ